MPVPQEPELKRESGMSIGKVALACAVAFAISGCGAMKSKSDPYQIALTPTVGSAAAGALSASPVPGGVRFRGRITGLVPASIHGFHVHQHGDCSASDASTAGGHFDPTASEHGDPSGMIHHAGDMPNLVADAQGNVDVDVTVKGLSIGTGISDDVQGRALILHRDPDDYTTQPAGNTGPRIACGVILKKQ
jgi:Cu-Zn family superoxide dismutase